MYELLLCGGDGGLRSTIVPLEKKIKKNRHVSLKRNNCKAPLFLYNNVSRVATPPPAPPPPQQLLYESRQPMAEGNSMFYWGESQGSCSRPVKPAGRAASEGVGSKKGGGGEGPHCVPDDWATIYMPALPFTWRRKVITAQTQAFETVSCPMNNGIGGKELSDWMS